MKPTIFALLLFVGCAPVPDAPTYDDDVRAILVANCSRCHGPPPAGAQDPRFCLRVDSWESVADTTSPDIEGSIGACPNDLALAGELTANIAYGVRDEADLIVSRVLDGSMPPDGPGLTERQKEILERWRETGFPRRPSGANHAPTIEFITPPAGGATVELTYDVQYRVADEDGDRVTWSLGWEGGVRPGTFVTGLTDGEGTVTIDTSVLGSGTYALVAHLDDGSEQVEVAAEGMLTVPEGRNARPTIAVLAPNGGESFYDTETVDVVFLADDLDAATLTCDVVAVEGNTTVTIANGVSVTPGQQETVSWPLSGVAPSSGFRVRVTVTDDGVPPLTAMDESDAPFDVTAPPQQVDFTAQILPLFQRCDGGQCHDSSMPQEGLNLTAGAAYGELVGVASSQCPSNQLVDPGDPVNSYLVKKVTGSGDCLVGSLMPKPPEQQLTADQIQLIRDWIANGAPQ